MKKISKGTWARTTVLVVALINQMLVMAGWDTLPFTGEDVQLVISGAFTAVASIVAWWKDNNVTEKAIENDKYLKRKGLK